MILNFKIDPKTGHLIEADNVSRNEIKMLMEFGLLVPYYQTVTIDKGALTAIEAANLEELKSFPNSEEHIDRFIDNMNSRGFNKALPNKESAEYIVDHVADVDKFACPTCGQSLLMFCNIETNDSTYQAIFNYNKLFTVELYDNDSYLFKAINDVVAAFAKQESFNPKELYRQESSNMHFVAQQILEKYIKITYADIKLDDIPSIRFTPDTDWNYTCPFCGKIHTLRDWAIAGIENPIFDSNTCEVCRSEGEYIVAEGEHTTFVCSHDKTIIKGGTENEEE